MRYTTSSSSLVVRFGRSLPGLSIAVILTSLSGCAPDAIEPTAQSLPAFFSSTQERVEYLKQCRSIRPSIDLVADDRFVFDAIPKDVVGFDFAATINCAGKDCPHSVVLEVQVDDGGVIRDLGTIEIGSCWEESFVELPTAPGGLTIRFAGEVQGGAIAIGEPRWRRKVAESRPPDVLLVSIDTLRLDFLGTYGLDPSVSPFIDRFADESVTFEAAISQAPWTTPSHMSMLTGLYPSSHRVNQSFNTLQNDRASYRVLPKGIPTLAMELREAGYRTAGFVSAMTMSGDLGFERGFDRYDYVGRKAEPMAMDALQSYLEQNRDRPSFVFFHTFEVHRPYTRFDGAIDSIDPKLSDELARVIGRDELVDAEIEKRLFALLEEAGIEDKERFVLLYKSAIRHADSFVEELIGSLSSLDLLDETLVIITSDHGEEFGEHLPRRLGRHGHQLYDELIRVPLIIRFPGSAAIESRRVPEIVELVDLTPTVLDLLGIAQVPTMQGKSLLPLLKGTAEDDGLAYSEATAFGPERKSVRAKDQKYIATFDEEISTRSGFPGRPVLQQFFDLQSDPGEQDDLSATDQGRVEAMARLCAAFFRSLEAQGDEQVGIEIDDSRQDELKALGYID